MEPSDSWSLVHTDLCSLKGAEVFGRCVWSVVHVAGKEVRLSGLSEVKCWTLRCRDLSWVNGEPLRLSEQDTGVPQKGCILAHAAAAGGVEYRQPEIGRCPANAQAWS